MPYSNIEDLPKKVRNSLPVHAQEIYLSSFNNAYKEYQDNNKLKDPQQNLEAICAKVAWNAVKQKYHKDTEGNWIED